MVTNMIETRMCSQGGGLHECLVRQNDLPSLALIFLLHGRSQNAVAKIGSHKLEKMLNNEDPLPSPVSKS